MTSTDPTVRIEAARGLDRRQLLKAGAWAAPAIVIAAAVPAASASNEPVALAAANLTLVASCSGLKHGFTLTNNSGLTGTVTISFWAQAWGLTSTAATNNLNSVTVASSGATYAPAVSGYAYNTLWNGAITTAASTGGGGVNAKRTGTAVIALAANQTVQIWQQNLNAAGEPRVEAQITAINNNAVSGPYAKFDLNWVTGTCK